MQKDPADGFKQAALQALKENDTVKAVELLEKSAKFRTDKAAQDWIDIGNIAYLNDTHKALNAYEKATNLAPANPVAWNGLGHIQHRLGNMDKTQFAYEKVLKLAGEDKAIQQESMAVAYGNLGNIYSIRGNLDKACGYWQKSLELFTGIGAKNEIDMVNQWISENCKS